MNFMIQNIHLYYMRIQDMYTFDIRNIAYTKKNILNARAYSIYMQDDHPKCWATQPLASVPAPHR